MPRFVTTLCLLLATLLASAPASLAQESSSETALSMPGIAVSDQNGLPVIETRLVGSHTQARPGQTVTLAWEFTLAPHWHIYWKNAGDSGLPPELSAQQGSLGPLTYPLPKPISIPPLTNYGYEDAVTFTIPYTIPDAAPAGEQTFTFSGNFLYCKDVCLPGTVKLDLPLIVATTEISNPDFSPRQNLPQPLPAGASASRAGATFLLTLPPSLATQLLRFIPSEDGIIDDSAEQTLKGNTLSLPADPQSQTKVDTLSGILLAGQTGYRVDLPFTAPPADAAPPPPAGTTLATALLFALLAGLILNLMPCVLPVLSLKVMHLVRYHHGPDRTLHTVSYTLGVLFSFWALAAVIGVLSNAGFQLGWGFHLQNATFVAALAAVMVVIATLFFGLFELGETFTRLGATGKRNEHPWASFATGILAVVVATPCTAPFMGVAVAYALTQSSIASFLVFTAMGLGMALPFLLTVLFPSMLKWLPKPGEWMTTFRILLGWPMLATALWLVYVFASQEGTFAAFMLMSWLMLFSFLLWAYGLRHRAWKGILAALVIVGGLYGLHHYINRPEMSSAWQQWSPQAVARAKDERPVFVDFTADWCITCKVTEATVLNTQSTQALFRKHDTLLLKADWTKQNPAITQELESHGRKGVPLYLLYKPGQAQPTVLPQLLTPGILEDALSAPR